MTGITSHHLVHIYIYIINWHVIVHEAVIGSYKMTKSIIGKRC